MSRKRKELPLLSAVEITDVAAEGKALVRIDDLVVFVPFVIPGDIVDLQLTKKKHSYAEAEAVRILQPSKDRLEPFCPHFGVCGGCKWQMLPYELQLQAKQKQVMDALTRIGKVELPPCSPILGSKKIQEYRNKLEFGFCNRRWLTKEQIRSGEQFEHQESVGFHTTGSFDKILPIEECHLMEPVNDRIRLFIRDYAYDRGLTFYDQREHTGLLRGMMIRTSNTGGLMLLIQFCMMTEEEHRQAQDLLKAVADNFPEITSLLYVDNQKWNDTFGDLPVNVFRGEDHIFLQMEDLRFKVGPKSFYQTNTDQALELYNVARTFALSPSFGPVSGGLSAGFPPSSDLSLYRRHAELLTTLYHYRDYEIQNPSAEAHFTALMLICAHLCQDAKGEKELQQRALAQLEAINAKGPAKAATDTRTYLWIALKISTGDPQYRDLAKDYIRTKQPKSPQLRQFVTLISKKVRL